MSIEVTNGELEFVPTPGHVNLIGRDGEFEAELRLSAVEWEELRQGMGADQRTDIDTESGMVSWEPGRGMYVELYDGPDFYLILSPDDREKVLAAMRTTEVMS